VPVGRNVERISVVVHRGKQILVQDFSRLTPGEEFRDSIAKARRHIAGQPPKSVLSLFDATGARYDTEVVGALKVYARDNEPHIKASAVVGIEGLLRIGLTVVAGFSGRTFKTFKDRASAMDWLVEQ